MPIRVLSPQEAARIAAGEVIERPASVVKELIENALDSGARQITVETRQGGIALMRITDDGCGIPPEELGVAFERHATSKVQSEDELWRIATLGFRGEALPSIAAAANVELASRPAGALVAGRIVLRDGAMQHQGSAGAPPGTSVTVEGLFGRQPARLKFLRSPAAESAQIATVVSQYALAYPEVRFTLRNDGKETLLTPGNGDLLDAAAAVYGVPLASELLPIDDGGQGSIRVSGLAGSPAVSRANRSYISFFVNRRWVRDRSLSFAVIEAYQGMLPIGRFPVAIVEVRMPPEEVDVNVHPTKAEVRFREERAVFAAVQRAVRRTVASQGAVPTFDPRSSIFEARGFPASTEQRQNSGVDVLRRASSVDSPASSSQPLASAGEPVQQVPMLDTLPLLRAVGQVGNTYVIAEGPEGMYLVDQHAAHERVLYERFLAQRRNGAPDVQPLLQPQPVELSARQRSMLDLLGTELAASGIALEPFGEDGAYLVRAVPPSLAKGDVTRAVSELLDLLGREDLPAEANVSKDDPAHRVAASLACHASVRAGQVMTGEEQRELLKLLEASEQPRTCPHGRPTMVHVSTESLERQFRRR